MSTRKLFRVSEVVLRTTDYDRLCAFYSTLLDRQPDFDMKPPDADNAEDPDAPARIAFFDLHVDYPYTQRLAVFDCRPRGSSERSSTGLHHFQLRLENLQELFSTYGRLSSLRILPENSANHGPGTSIYYRDPDDNVLELSALNFLTEAEMRQYMASEEFQQNPVGFPIAPDQIVARHAQGEALSSLVWWK